MGHDFQVRDPAHPPGDGVENLEGLGGPVVAGFSKAAHGGAPCLDVGEVTGLKHGLDDGGGVEGVAGLGGGHGEEVEGVGVEEVEQALMVEALDDGLGTVEAIFGLLLG